MKGKNWARLLACVTGVVLANYDYVDKLGVVTHRSIAVWANIHRRNRVNICLGSKPCCASAGDSRVAPSNRSPATFREASETDASRSAPLGVARHRVA